MANLNIAKIKRSTTTATPPTLAEGELAYSENSGNLFIGTSGANLEKIGGNTDVLKLAGIEVGAQVNTVDSVNGQTGVVSLASGDLSDVTLTTIATGDVLQWNVGGFWENVAANTVGVTDHTLLTNIGTNTHASIDTHIADISPHNHWIHCYANANFNLAPTSLGHTNAIAMGYGVATDGASEVHIGSSNTTKIKLDSTGNFSVLGSEAQVVHPNYATSSLPIGTLGSTVFDATTGSLKLYTGSAWVEVSPDLSNYVDKTSDETVAGAKTFSGDMIINADLTVNGTTTTIDSDNVTITDNIITYNFGELGAGVTLGTSGIEIDRGTSDNTQWIWNEATDKWGYKTGAAAFVPVADEVHVHDTSDITTGTFANARIAESNVTQHEGAINHDALLNFVADEHIAHSGVVLTAGVGIAGGGDITTSRTFDLDLNSLAALAESDGSTDYVVVYEAGVGHKKMLINDLLDGGQF